MKFAQLAATLTIFWATLASATPPPNPQCHVAYQSKTPPYSITIRCKPDCRHKPKLRTVKELIADGVDPKAAPGVVEIQTGYWQRACPENQPVK
jgi:hypothetical protein